MIYKEAYKYLLCLMNKGVTRYTVIKAARDSELDSHEIEAASHELEERGIVRACGKRSYAFVGGIDLLRELVISDHTVEPFADADSDAEPISAKDITSTEWSLVKSEEPPGRRETITRRRPTFRGGRPFPNVFDDEDDNSASESSDDDDTDIFDTDDDDDDIDKAVERIFGSPRQRRSDRMDRLAVLVDSYIAQKENYDPDTKSFSPQMKICYPDGTPLVLQYVVKDGSHYFVDKGHLRDYLTRLAGDLPPHRVRRWIETELQALVGKLPISYDDGVIYSDIECSDDNDDLNGEVTYFVKAFENFFFSLNERYKERELSEREEFAVTKATSLFWLRTYDKDFGESGENVDACARDLLISIARLCDEIQLSHAKDVAKKMVELAGCASGCTNGPIFNRLVELIDGMTPMQFQIAKKILG